MTLSKKEINYIHNRHVVNTAALCLMLLIIFGPYALARSEENAGKDEPINYVHIETQRVIKLQEENRFLLQRLKSLNEKMEAVQAEMLSVRNAYLEREDIIPRTQKEVSKRYEEKVGLLKEEIRQLKKDLADQTAAFESLDVQRSMIQNDLSSAAQTKGELQATIGRLEVELGQAHESLASREKKYTEQSDALSKKNREQAELQERMAQANKSHDEELTRVNEQTERLKKESEALAASSSLSLKASEQEHENKSKELQKKIEELARSRDEETKALNKEKEDLHAQLKVAQERTGNIENGKEKLATEISELKALLNDGQTKANSLEEALKAKDEEIAKLQQASQAVTQSAAEVSAKLAEKEREFVSKLAALEEANIKAAQEHSQALDGLKADLAQKDSQVASLKSEKENDTQPLIQKINELEGKLGFASQQNKEFQEKANTLAQLNSTLEQQLKETAQKIDSLSKEKAALESANAAVNASGEQVALLEKKIEELRNKIQDDELELKSTQNENELLLSELSAAGSLPQESQETLTLLTRELLTSENTVYEKELIIEGLRSDQIKLERALELSQDNYDMLKAELEGLKVNEVSYNGRDSVLDLELNKLEERVERQLMEH